MSDVSHIYQDKETISLDPKLHCCQHDGCSCKSLDIITLIHNKYHSWHLAPQHRTIHIVSIWPPATWLAG